MNHIFHTCNDFTTSLSNIPVCFIESLMQYFHICRKILYIPNKGQILDKSWKQRQHEEKIFSNYYWKSLVSLSKSYFKIAIFCLSGIIMSKHHSLWDTSFVRKPIIIQVLRAPEAVFCFSQQNAKEHNQNQGVGGRGGKREGSFVYPVSGETVLLSEFTPDHKLSHFIDSFTGCFPLFIPGDSK